MIQLGIVPAGPQLVRTRRTVFSSTPSRSANGFSVGAAATIAPTFRSRFGQPSSRRPMPLANESSTVEWQSADWMARPVIFLVLLSKMPVSPTTVRAKQLLSGLRPVEIDRAGLQGLQENARQRADVDLESELQRLPGGDPGPRAAQLLPGDRLVKTELSAPE